MKKLFILSFLSFSALIFQSCNDNSNEIPETTVDESLIIGEWILKDVYSKNGALEATKNGQTVKGIVTVKGSNYNNIQKFTENPNKLISTGGLTITTTTTMLGQSETDIQEIPDRTISGNWSIKGNKLTSRLDQQSSLPSVVTINELTESSLILNQNLSDANQSDGSITLKFSGNLFFVYTKK